MSDNDTTNGWTKLYHPSGVQVTLPISVNGEALSPVVARTALQSVSVLLEAGWLVNAPGLEEGEHVEEIQHVVKRVKNNDDGTETPVIDLYPERANFRVLGLYLNTPQDVQAFEAACDVHLTNLPLYEGDNTIERGKGPKTDKYVIPLPHLSKVVWKANPRWEGDEDKKHPKRLFVRWADAPASNGTTTAPPQTPTASSEPVAETMTIEEARQVIMHLAVKTQGLQGKTLGELQKTDAGRKVIAYLAEAWKPSGGDATQDLRLQEAAKLLSKAS